MVSNPYAFLLFAFCFLLSAFCFLLSAFCFLLSAFVFCFSAFCFSAYMYAYWEEKKTVSCLSLVLCMHTYIHAQRKEPSLVSRCIRAKKDRKEIPHHHDDDDDYSWFDLRAHSFNPLLYVCVLCAGTPPQDPQLLKKYGKRGEGRA